MPRAVTTDSELVGRGAQLEQLTDLLARTRGGRGGVAILEGEPGAGKTVLAGAAIRVATGFEVLRCGGVESDVELPFSGLHELLLPLLPRIAELAGDQRSALSAALAMVDEAPSSPVAVAMAALSLVAQAADARPVLLVADDVHWMDGATVAVLSFVARRLAHDRIALLVTTRPSDAAGQIEGERITLDPLGHAEAGELVAAIAGHPLPDDTVASLVAATGGNPLAVIETVRSLGDDVTRLGTILDEPPPASELIRRGFATRVARLPDRTRAALGALATAVDTDAQRFHSALGELGIDPAALDQAETAGIVRREPGTIVFCHPLLRAVAYHETSPADRRRFHAALAQVAADRGSRAWHAASACQTADEAIAAELESAAGDFDTRGGYLAAARALERAARLTPDPGEQARRLTLAANAARWASRVPWALTLAEEAQALTTDRRLLAEIARFQVAVGVMYGDGNAYGDYLRLAESVVDIDPELAAHTLGGAALEGTVSGRMDDARAAIARLRAIGATPDQASLSAEGIVLLLSGDDPHRGRGLLLEAGRMGAAELPLAPFAEVAEALVWIEEYTLAEALISEAFSHSRATGGIARLADAYWLDGHRRFRIGEWAMAESSLEQARHLATSGGIAWAEGMICATLGMLRASRGDESASALIAHTAALAEASDYGFIEPFLGTALGLLDLAGGRPAVAIPHFERAEAWCARAEQREPGVLPWPADLVEAYALAGERDQALAGLARLRERADATGRGWALGAVARLDGLLTETEDYEPHFERAARRFEGLPAPFELARTRLHYGRRLRRSGQRVRARTELHGALRVFEHLRAAAWAEQARTELQATGETLEAAGGAAKPVQLTPQEICVADGVAQGLTNKQIAAQLFLTPKTIEWHLRQIYRKLGIRSRVQLAQHMASSSPAPS